MSQQECATAQKVDIVSHLMTKDDLKFNSNIKVSLDSQEATIENAKSQEIGLDHSEKRQEFSNHSEQNENDFDQLRCISNVDQLNLKKDKTSSIFEYQDRSASQLKYPQMFPGSNVNIPEFDFNNEEGSPSVSQTHIVPGQNKDPFGKPP